MSIRERLEQRLEERLELLEEKIEKTRGEEREASRRARELRASRLFFERQRDRELEKLKSRERDQR